MNIFWLGQKYHEGGGSWENLLFNPQLSKTACSKIHAYSKQTHIYIKEFDPVTKPVTGGAESHTGLPACDHIHIYYREACALPFYGSIRE